MPEVQEAAIACEHEGFRGGLSWSPMVCSLAKSDMIADRIFLLKGWNGEGGTVTRPPWAGHLLKPPNAVQFKPWSSRPGV